jgi:hypothetical protein
MTEEEFRKMIREALSASRVEGEMIRDMSGSSDLEDQSLRTPVGMEQKEYPVSYAKQLPPGLLSEQKVDMPGTDGKQIMLQGNIPLPVGSIGVQGGMMPTFGQKMAGVSYNLPVGEGNLSVGGGMTTAPRMQGAAKTANAAYSRKMLEDLYMSAYINQMLGQGSKSPSVGVGIQGLF